MRNMTSSPSKALAHSPDRLTAMLRGDGVWQITSWHEHMPGPQIYLRRAEAYAAWQALGFALPATSATRWAVVAQAGQVGSARVLSSHKSAEAASRRLARLQAARQVQGILTVVQTSATRGSRVPIG